MKTMTGLLAVGLLCLATGPLALGQVVDQPPSRVDRGLQELKQGVSDVAATVREKFDQAKIAIHNLGVEGRVYSRIHWDKALTDEAVQMEMQSEGVVVLNGSVRNEMARVKAVQLTNDTVGVTQVIDHLAVKATAA